MKGCTDYTREAVGWKQDAHRRNNTMRVVLVFAFIALVALIVFVVWPKINGGGLEVASAQVSSNAEAGSNDQQSAVQPKVGDITKFKEAQEVKIVVYLTGAITSPGVFELGAGSRLNDAIVVSGGLKDDAAYSYVNLAANLEDGMHIHIPTQEEVLSGEAERISNSAMQNIGSSSSSGVDSSQKLIKININTADIKKLQELDGIGEATAKKIVDYREKYGFFKSTEDLKNVSGIGDKKYEGLADSICV